MQHCVLLQTKKVLLRKKEGFGNKTDKEHGATSLGHAIARYINHRRIRV